MNCETKRKPGRPAGTTKETLMALSSDEVKRFFVAVKNHGTLKAKLAFHLTFHLGLRVQELVNLKVADVRDGGLPQDLAITVRGLKGNRVRTYNNLPGDLVTKIRSYLKNLQPGSIYLFPSPASYDRPMTAQAWKSSFKRLANLAGLDRGFSIHSLRHACAVRLVEQGLDAHAIMDWLRHKRLESTAVYFARRDLSQVGKKVTQAFQGLV
jgi:integrase/recombinase XerD